MKTCPRCGFTGDISHCPNDGEVLLASDDLARRQAADPTMAPEPVARAHPAVPVAVAPTIADLSNPDVIASAGVSTSADTVMGLPDPPPEPSAGHDHDADAEHKGPPVEEVLRDENFGKWAEPEVKKKAGDPMIGRMLSGRYEIISLLGQGGMGAVYKARQPAVKRMIALKVLLKEFAENDTVVKRFHQEALAASRLTHPNTIKVFDFGQTEDGILYMAMELLRGESLAHALSRGGPMAPKRVVHIMRQCCKSLSEAHKAGIIHRDLKPDNIFLVEIEGERDFAKVLDFGVAKLKEYEGKEGTLTQAGMIFGTPKYMSPEQARSANLDARSDVYALGVIMYEMLMGKPPFTADNPLSILISHVNEQPRRFAQFNPGLQIPTALEAVVFKALAKDREQRHPSVDHMLAEFEAVDELLMGTPYETLAGRLPALLPGAEGDPSLVGPAFVPAGQSGTAPATPLEKGGTIRLGEDGQPILGDQSPTTSMPVGEIMATSELEVPRKKSGLGLFVGIGLAAAGMAAAAVVALKPAPPAPDPLPDAPASSGLAAAGAGPATNAPTAAPTEAPNALASAGQADGKNLKACLIVSEPAGAKVFEAAAPDVQVGVTKANGLTVRIEATTKYLVKQTGYRDGEVTVDVGADPCVAQVRLKAMPRAISQSGGGTAGANPTPGGGTIVIGTPGGDGAKPANAPERPSTRPDISIQ